MKPKMTGINTAAIWLIENDTPELDAISAGSAIFWKYVLSAIAIEKKRWSAIYRKTANALDSTRAYPIKISARPTYSKMRERRSPNL